MGCVPNASELKALAEAAAFLGVNQQANYSEASRAAAIVQAATKQISNHIGIDPESLLPVHNLAAAIHVLLDMPELKAGNFSISAVSRRALLQEATKLGATVITVDQTGVESEPVSTWHLTQAGNPETGNIPELSRMAEGSNLILDATEWVGRMEGLPVGEIILIRASSWGSIAPVCFLIKASGSWKLSKFERQQIAPSPFLLVTAAQSLKTHAEYAEIASSHRLWLQTFADQVSTNLRIHWPDATEQQLPHLRTFLVEDLDAQALTTELDKMGIAVGAGSACGLESGSSHVMDAMGWKSATNIRIGLPLSAQQADLEVLAESLPTAIQRCGI
jgi:cysteine sulfinate desulfinase/cysteine desulfurase-like protein